jgi:RNA polymerase nonessential primary-like sigma factor
MVKKNSRESYGSETSLPITRKGISKSFGLYQKLCDRGALTLESKLTMHQVHELIDTGALLEDRSGTETYSLAEIILEQVEGHEWLTENEFPDGVLRKYGWSRGRLNKALLEMHDYKVDDDSGMDDFQIYMRSIRNHPIYSEKAQIGLGWKIRNKDMDARNRLVVSNLKYAAGIAIKLHKKYRVFSAMQFVEWANELLMDATETYDPRENVSFTSYVRTILERELRERMNEFRRNIRFPSRTFYLVYTMRNEINLFAAENGRAPSLNDLIHRLNWKESKVRRIYQVYQLNKMDYANADENLRAECPSADTELEKKEFKEQVEKMLFYVGPVKSRILRLLYGIDCKTHTLREAAKVMGLSHERINQLQLEAKNDIRSNPCAYRQVEAFLNTA